MSASPAVVQTQVNDLNEQLRILKFGLMEVQTLAPYRPHNLQAKPDQGLLMVVQSGDVWLTNFEQFQNRIRLKKLDFVFIRESVQDYSLHTVMQQNRLPSELPNVMAVQDQSLEAHTASLLIAKFQFDLFQLPLLQRVLPKYLHRNLTEVDWCTANPFQMAIESILHKQFELLLLQIAFCMIKLRAEERRALETATSTKKLESRDPRFTFVAEKLATELDVAWTVESMAKLIFVSRSTFAQRFHEQIGIPPLEYLYKLRMERAQKLLKDSHLEISVIGRLVGYDSPSSFSSAFKRFYGQSPIVFRREVVH